MPTSYLSETWFDPRLDARPSPLHGTGLFVASLVTAGETVMVWGGTIYTPADLADMRAGRRKVAPFSYSYIDEDLMMAAPDDGLDYFVNHSCDPSVWMADEVTVVARRDIPPGGEVTGDYAVWEADPAYLLEDCRCGTALCRGRVTGDDWRRPDLQQRYAGHFLPFLNRRIAQL